MKKFLQTGRISFSWKWRNQIHIFNQKIIDTPKIFCKNASFPVNKFLLPEANLVRFFTFVPYVVGLDQIYSIRESNDFASIEKLVQLIKGFLLSTTNHRSQLFKAATSSFRARVISALCYYVPQMSLPLKFFVLFRVLRRPQCFFADRFCIPCTLNRSEQQNCHNDDREQFFAPGQIIVYRPHFARTNGRRASPATDFMYLR